MTEAEARGKIAADVSRETMARLDRYGEMLIKWQKAINLVSSGTLNEIWSRHFLDSAQLVAQCTAQRGLWLDIGSGGGFPGLVCAAIASEKAPDLTFSLVESDRRKAAFLRTVAAEMGLAIEVLSERIEDARPQNARVLSARAVAPLTVLLGFAERHLAQGGTALFLKGATHQNEIVDALEQWRFDVASHSSQTAAKAVILEIKDIRRA